MRQIATSGTAISIFTEKRFVEFIDHGSAPTSTSKIFLNTFLKLHEAMHLVQTRRVTPLRDLDQVSKRRFNLGLDQRLVTKNLR